MTQEILISVRGLGLTYKVRRSLFSPIFVPALSEVSFDVYKGETWEWWAKMARVNPPC